MEKRERKRRLRKIFLLAPREKENARERERDELEKGREKEDEDFPSCASPHDERERSSLLFFSIFSLINFTLKTHFSMI